MMKQYIINALKRVPIDLGQGHFRHTTKAKTAAFSIASAQTGKRLLDLGCGDGFWSEKFKKLNFQVISVDKDVFGYSNTQKVNLENLLPFPDNSFDIVWSAEVIEHIDNAKQIISEIHRVLKPDGTIVATVPNSCFWIMSLVSFFGIHPRQLQNPDHKHFFSYQDIKELFPKATILGFFPYFLIKATIRHGVHALSPTLIIIESKSSE